MRNPPPISISWPRETITSGDLSGLRRDDRGERKQRRPRTIVDDERVLGAGQLLEERHRVVVARASRAGVEIVLQVGVAGGRIVGRQSRPLGEDRASQVGVKDHACCVDDAPQTSTCRGAWRLLRRRPSPRPPAFSRDDLAPQASERLADGRRRRKPGRVGRRASVPTGRASRRLPRGGSLVDPFSPSPSCAAKYNLAARALC